MQHHFRAYVFRLRPHTGDDSARVTGARLATVVAHHASPDFTLISYRRASAVDGRLSAPAAGATNPPADYENNYEEKPAFRTLFETERGSTRQASVLNAVNMEGINDTANVRRSNHLEPARPTDHFIHHARVQDPTHTRGEAPLCRVAVSVATKEKLQHLRILVLFLHSLPLQEFAFHADAMTIDIRRRWLYPVFAHVQQPLADHFMSTFSLSTLLDCFGSPDTTLELSVRCQPVVATCVSALLQCYDARSLQSVAPSFYAGAVDTSDPRRGIPDKSKLLELLSSFVDVVYDSIGRVLSQEGGRFDSVGALVDEVISLTYQEDALVAVRRQVTNILRESSDAQTFYRAMFRKFVAQMNAIGVSLRTTRGDGIRPSSLHLWNGRWLFNTQSIRTMTGRVARSLSRTILQVVKCLHQVLCVDLVVNNGECWVRSVVPESTRPLDGSGMTLVLDGRCRVFGAFPNGLASMATLAMEDDWVWGDYIGQVGTDGQSLQVVFFTFRKGSATQDELETTSSTVLQPTTVRRVTVTTSARPNPAAGEQVDDVWELPVGAVVDSAQYQPQEHSEADMSGLVCSSRIARFARLGWTRAMAASATYFKWTID